MTILCCFNQDNIPFLSVPSVVFVSSLLVALKMVLRENADLEMDRVTTDAQSDHHWQPQLCRQSSAWWSSPPPCWCVLVAALPDSLQGNFLRTCLRPRLKLIVIFQHATTAVIVQWVQIWSLVPFILLIADILLQPVLHDACMLRNEGGLGWNGIILSFLDAFQQKMVIKCYFIV